MMSEDTFLKAYNYVLKRLNEHLESGAPGNLIISPDEWMENVMATPLEEDVRLAIKCARDDFFKEPIVKAREFHIITPWKNPAASAAQEMVDSLHNLAKSLKEQHEKKEMESEKMSGEMTGQVPKQERKVFEIIKRMDSRLSDVFEQVSALREKVNDYMLPPLPQAQSDKEAAAPSNQSRLIELMENLDSRVAYLWDELHSIIGRLE